MERTLLKDLHEHIEKEVTIQGRIIVRRDHGKLIFFDLSDRSGVVQMVALPEHDGVVDSASKVRQEFVLEVKGKVNKRPERMVKADQANGDLEIEILSINILAEAEEMPFDMDADLNLDTNLDFRPLTLRSEKEKAIFKVQAVIVEAYREALNKEDFTEFQAPKIVGDDAEGGANIFKIEYLKNQDAYLATSPQFYKQILVGVFERCYSVGNVFRAEKHATTRHTNEYTSMDAEMGFITDHHDVMNMETKVMHNIVNRLKEKCEAEFATLGATFPKLPETIPFMKLSEAQELITKETGESCVGEPDLEPAHERWLCEYAEKELDSDFIFITHYPVSKRPMYTYEDEKDPGFTKSFDLLFRGVEITSGGQRVHDYKTLVQKIKDKGLNPESFSFYLQAFKYGIAPHGGWGIGLERLTQKFLGLQNIREATLFPRDINRIDTRLSK